MSYKLRADESIEAAIHRSLAAQIDGAVASLSAAAETPGAAAEVAESVHDARKRFKKIRSLLRLVRGSLPAKVRQAENEVFRDLGRLLSASRDSVALHDSLGELIDSQPKAARKEFASLRDELARRRDAAAGPTLDLLTDAVATLVFARGRWERLSLNDTGFAAVRAGLGANHKAGRAALRTAVETPSDETFHELRKRAKDLWYHLRFFKPVWPDVLGAYAGEAEKLSDRLGDDHDLALLWETVSGEPDAFANEKTIARLGELVAERRRELQLDAVLVARQLFGESPRVAVGRLKRAWQTWCESLRANDPPAEVAAAVAKDLDD